MDRHPGSDYEKMMVQFANLPNLTFDRVTGAAKGLPFTKPELSVRQGVRERWIDDLNSHIGSQSSTKQKISYDLLEKLPVGKPSGMSSISVLLEATDKAAGKLTYGRTPMEEWNRRLVFINDTVQRKKNGAWKSIRCTSDLWQKGDAINASRGKANHWFLNKLIPEMNHSVTDAAVVRGMAGSGKSTILKYLILNNFDELKAQNVVFSRFEMMKFWTLISGMPKENFEDYSKRYAAEIHTRDLLLHRFCRYSKEGRFTVNQTPPTTRPKLRVVGDAEPSHSSPALEEELIQFSYDLDAFVTQYGTQYQKCTGDVASVAELDEIRQTVSVLATPGADLQDALKVLDDHQLHVMIFVLARGKTLVTIYDGIDAVRPEDILSRDENEDGRALWWAACEVIRRHRTLGDYRALFVRTPQLKRRSLLVVRNNTLTELSRSNEPWAKGIVDLPAYDVGSIPVRAAAVSTARTIISYIPEFQGPSTTKADRHRLASVLLRPFERAMTRIFQLVSKDNTDDQLQKLFDGNLRKLFRLITLMLKWTHQEMLRGKLLDKQDFQVSTDKLLHLMASQRGLDFLAQKNYRVVESLLVGGAGWFENAVVMKSFQTPAKREMTAQLRSNEGHHGVLDNILNYHIDDPCTSINDHMLIEKVRYLQILSEPLLWDDVPGNLSKQLGYKESDEAHWNKLMFLMKTGFVVVDTEHPDGHFRFHTSARGRLALALLSNLGYIENVFHQTLFPKVMVKHLADVPRADDGNIVWAARSIRNAFIFLTYFRCLEDNPLHGQPVPPRLRRFDKIHDGLLHTVQLMTAPVSEDAGSKNGAEEVPNIGEALGSREEIAKLAVKEISDLLDHWRRDRLISLHHRPVPTAPV